MTPNAPTTEPMSLTGTQIAIHSDQMHRVTIEPADAGLWCQVLHSFIDRHAPELSEAPLKVMLLMFRHRDRETGRTRIDRATLISGTRLSKAAVSEALTLLQASDPRLLAAFGSSEFEVMPGRGFAGNRVRPREREFATANTCSPPRTDGVLGIGNPRAPASTNQTKREMEINTKTTIEADSLFRCAGSLVGWQGRTPETDLAIVAGDVPGLLSALGLRGDLLARAAAVPGLTVERVLEVARSVDADRGARNRPVCIAHRLGVSVAMAKRPVGPMAGSLMGEVAKLDAIRRAKMGVRRES